jgi:uncharacterized protein
MDEHSTPQGKPLIEYPSVYAFKVIGLRGTGFEDLMAQLFETGWGASIPPDAVVENRSKGGKYVSLTISLELPSEQVRLKIYDLIHAEKRIVYYL